MRNKNQEITDRSAIDDIIRRCPVCHLGLMDGDRPYVIPLCFGYDGSALYFHCANQGMKLDLLRKNPRVCAEFTLTQGVQEAAQVCGWGMEYESVIANGTVCFLEAPEEKRAGLNLLMTQYDTSGRTFSFPAIMLNRMVLFKVPIESITGKKSS